MIQRIAFLLCPLLALAPKAPAQQKPGAPAQKEVVQTKAPEAVDEALRARVNEFFQYHVTGEYRKALPLVAEDTQDAYFAQGKMKLKSFKLDSVQYLNDDFTKARVTLTVVRDWQIRMQTNEAIIPMVTDWKIENGKWVWYYDIKERWLTPMGPSNIEPPKQNADGTIDLPKNLSQEIIAARARAILGQSAIDKSEVRLDSQGATGQVTFTNSMQGPVEVSLVGVPQIPGFSAKLDRTEVPAGDRAVVSLSYDSNASHAPFTIQLMTQPFNQAYGIRVMLGKPEDK
jgi:hypothetical protein